MPNIGIICEYNPLHNGHRRQLLAVKDRFPDGGVVCLMSGNYVQRGAPALLEKTLRAQAALECGADLVLEMPLTGSLSSAEGFAAAGVGILDGFCDCLCFGAETGTAESLTALAEQLLLPEFDDRLRDHLAAGVSFPRARQLAVRDMGGEDGLLENPNDILGVEYCKAILRRGSSMIPLPVRRMGSHAVWDGENPSAAAVRERMCAGSPWEELVPPETAALYRSAPLHTWQNGEKAVLYRLRTMTDQEFEALPYGAEGLWRKLMHNARTCDSVCQVAEQTKSKRYTRTRLDRMILCAFLGITGEMLTRTPPYIRVLGLNETGGKILKQARKTGTFLNAGAPAPESAYADLERRSEDLYSLFAPTPRPPTPLRVIVK